MITIVILMLWFLVWLCYNLLKDIVNGEYPRPPESKNCNCPPKDSEKYDEITKQPTGFYPNEKAGYYPNEKAGYYPNEKKVKI